MGAISVIIVISIIVLGFAFWMYNRSKPKRIGYIARVYKEVGSGIERDVQVFMKDFLYRSNPAPGIINWKLEKLKIMLPHEPSPENIEIEGAEKVINLLLNKGQLTTLKRKYDATRDAIVFEAFDFDKHAFCELRRSHELKRLAQKTNPLEYITKWIVVALTMFGLIAVSYVQAEGWVSSSENLLKASENNILAANIQSNATIQLQKILVGATSNINSVNNNQIASQTNPNAVKPMT